MDEARVRGEHQPVEAVSPPAATPDSPDNGADWRLAAALALVAVLFYAPLSGWGIPHATAPDRVKPFAVDDLLPLGPLAEMHNTFVVSKPDRSYAYPWFQYFVDAVAEAPYLGYLYATGRAHSSSMGYPFGLADPDHALRMLTLAGRAMTLLMAAGTLVAVFFFARTLWGRTAGVIALALTSVNYLMVYYARTGNTDVPAFFWISLGMVVFARVLNSGLTPPRAAAIALCAGLGMATKDQVVVFFLPAGLILLLPGVNAPRGPYPAKALATGIGVFLLAYAFGTGTLFDPHRHVEYVHRFLFSGQIGFMGYYFPTRARTLAGFAGLAGDFVTSLVASISLPVLLAAAVGAWLVCRSSPRLLVLLLPVAALFVIVVMPMGYMVRRYCLPLTMIFDAFAACWIVSLYEGGRRALAAAVLAIALGYRALIAADLSYAQYHETRYAATDWFRAHGETGDRVESCGSSYTQPYLDAGILSRPRPGGWAPFQGRHDSRLPDQGAATTGPADFVLVIPDWTSTPGMQRSAECPPDVFDRLISGAAGYRLVAHFPSPALYSGLLARPPLDSPSVAPPVRVFARTDVVESRGLDVVSDPALRER